MTFVRRATTPALFFLAFAGGAFPAFLLALQGVYFEGPALWPQPFLAPFPLAATLLLEQWERRGRPRDLALGALVLGLGILVKQTFAWFGLAAIRWLLLGSRRRSPRAASPPRDSSFWLPCAG